MKKIEVTTDGKTRIFHFEGNKEGLMRKLRQEVAKEEFVKDMSTAKVCPECDRVYLKGEDARVDANMRCGYCAYSHGD